VHANCVAVDTPDNQTLRRATIQSSRPTTRLYLYAIYYIPKKWTYSAREDVLFLICIILGVLLANNYEFRTYLLINNSQISAIVSKTYELLVKNATTFKNNIICTL